MSPAKAKGSTTRQEEKIFLEIHNRDFEGRGVPNVEVRDVMDYEGHWQKIISRLKNTAP